ncbi:TetR/AcrR family transcriptional regulator [Dehalogenimonas sp. THU2]|uniref:TetR/AcrR family transcriptional regulator n=1 Tax=Dehalogenimonas sp. THU2 TaxID=3151121 RepID=UPI0032184345
MNIIERRRSAAGRRPKRELIIETTVELFRHADDVRKVSIENIAASARVSPTTIYNQFGTRDALVIEASRDLINDILERSRAILRSDKPFPTKMKGMITGKLEIARKANDEVVGKLMSQDRSIAPYLEELFQNEVRYLWREMLDQGKREGFIDPVLDEESFFIYMDVIRSGFAAKAELLKDWKNNMDLIEKLTNLVFYGFFKKEIDLFGTKE